MDQFITLAIGDQSFQLPLIKGSEGESAVDISDLRQNTGLVVIDKGFRNTASCKSAISFIDTDQGVLRYRGVSIEDLAEYSSFREVAYLLINGELPTLAQLQRFSDLLNEHSLVHEDMQFFFQKYPRASQPMGILAAMVTALKSFYPYLENIEEEINITVTRLLSKIRTMAAMSYKISRGHRVVYPRSDLMYCENFLNMMFDNPVRPYFIDEDVVRALSTYLIVHADDVQNCSTTAVKVVGSGGVNLYAAISAGIAALWGPLHGGSEQAAMTMLADLRKEGCSVREAVRRHKDEDDRFLLRGLGYRVFKGYDPRVNIMKKMFDLMMAKPYCADPLAAMARELEEIALADPYFVDNELYPNFDFYCGTVLHAIGIPHNMFPVIYAIGRLPGWIAQWKESSEDPDWLLTRPRQIYIGPNETPYVPIEER